jgi:glucose/arabinose dehydrogenase
MKPLRRVSVAALSALAVIFPAQPAGAGALPLTEIAPAHVFESPLYLTHAGDGRLFVVEQEGKIKVLQPPDYTTVSVFLDLTDKVTQGGGERGLLGLAFHPDYASNGRFYVNYTRNTDHDTIVEEYRRSSGNPNAADPESDRFLLRISHQDANNHNGGWMGFKGNLLYIATGDGGAMPRQAQNVKSLLGKILRINPLDPDGEDGPRTFGIPSSNPYVGIRGRDPIWSRGLRNPWRCSFDRLNGRMWCADVGQNLWEEINRVRTGEGVNYGWPIMEGRACYSPPSGCDTSGKVRPVAVYSHNDGRCSVTGGYVSRRSGADLYGNYVFGEFCGGQVWRIPSGFNGTLNHNTVENGGHLLFQTNFNISSFGEDAVGRIYLVDLGGGVYRLNDS